MSKPRGVCEQKSLGSTDICHCSWTACLLKMGPIDCPETLAQKCHSVVCTVPKERRSQWAECLPISETGIF